MANPVTITLTIPSEAIAKEIVQALCEGAGVEVSASNAKQVLIEDIKRRVENWQKSKAATTAPTIE
jgi:hypothetical protein